MIWHYHDDDVAGPAADVGLTISRLPLKAGEARLTRYRIDETHGNAFAAWKRMGSPQKPTPEQYAELERAGQLAALDSAEAARIADGTIRTRVKLDRQAVALLVLEWTPGK
jgi:xylan 1,4-beta-xylosidase